MRGRIDVKKPVVRRGRDFDPAADLCRICGALIGRKSLFFRDDPLPGERPDEVERFVHRECLFAEAKARAAAKLG